MGGPDVLNSEIAERWSPPHLQSFTCSGPEQSGSRFTVLEICKRD